MACRHAAAQARATVHKQWLFYLMGFVCRRMKRHGTIAAFGLQPIRLSIKEQACLWLIREALLSARRALRRPCELRVRDRLV